MSSIKENLKRIREDNNISSQFIKALKNHDLKKIKAIPKGDLHNHALLGMRFSQFNKYFNGQVKPPPAKMNGLEQMASYLDNETIKFIKSKREIEDLLELAINEAIDDGIVSLEASLDSSFISYYENKLEYFSMIKNLQDKYSRELHFKPELGVARVLPEKKWDEWVTPAINSGIFDSIDLYDLESVNKIHFYSKYYEIARNKNLKIKAHVGEFCDPEQIIETIKILKPEAIQHGIQAIKSQEAIDLIKAKNITLNICPTSNIKLGAVDSITNHPAPDLYKEGINITINTDDLMLFDSSVSEEYLKLYKEKLFTAEELNSIRLNSLK
jgi:adenosine deaminase